MMPPTERNEPEPIASPECGAFLERLHAVLDRESPVETLDDPHLARCDSCRETAAVARWIRVRNERPVAVPSELAGRIVAGALSERRTRRRVQWTFGSGLAVVAASLLIAGFLALDAAQPNPDALRAEIPPPQLTPIPEAPPPRLDERFADAGDAIASISRKAKDQTVTPTKNFLPHSGPVAPPKSGFPAEADPAAEMIAEIPQNAKSGIEPVTSSTVRAVNLFLRDTGVSPQAKPKS